MNNAGLAYDLFATTAEGQITNEGQRCIEPGADGPPTVTPAAAYAALQQILLPPSALDVAPPGGRTLVNFETIFSTAATPFDTSVTLLGQQVDFRISPSTYAWSYGDGTSQVTDSPGVAYAAGRSMDGYLTHRYLRATTGGDTMQARVDTTWSAVFRAAGGPWQGVPGTVTKQGDPVGLEVLTATPQLVAAE